MDVTEHGNGIRDVWSWALSWFVKPPSDPQKRARQTVLIEAIVQQLRGLDTVGDLHTWYTADTRWTLETAKQLYPRDWPTLGVHACTGAAYGLRYVEIQTGQRLDARQPLPTWIGEWAIWT